MCKSALTPHRVCVTSLAWQNEGRGRRTLKAFTFSRSEGNLRNEREKAVAVTAEEGGAASHH